MAIATDWMRHTEVDIKDSIKGFPWRIQKELSLAEMDKAGVAGMGKKVRIYNPLGSQVDELELVKMQL